MRLIYFRNIDTQEGGAATEEQKQSIADQLAGGPLESGEEEGDEGDEGKGEPGEQGAAAPAAGEGEGQQAAQEAAKPENEFFQKHLSFLKDKYGVNELPEDINEENYQEFFEKVIEERDQNLIKSYEERRQTSVPLSDDEEIARYLKEELGYNDDEVDEYVNAYTPKMKKIEADKLRREREKRGEGQQQQPAPQKKPDIEAQLNKAIESFKKEESILGVPKTEEENKAFEKKFKEVFTPDKNGNLPFYDILRDDNKLAKMIYIADKLENNPDYFSDIINRKIEEYKDKLDTAPEAHRGTVKISDKTDIANYLAS